MINSGNDPSSSNTGAWTNFTQPCATANPPTVSPLVCSSGNTTQVESGTGIGTTGGELQNVFADLLSCWQAATNKKTNWPLMLPVVDCPGNNVSNCAKLVGAVSLNIIWMIEKISEGVNKYKDVPRYMEIWGVDHNGDPVKTKTYDNPTTTEADDFEAWKDFVDEFKLKNADGRPWDSEDDTGYEQLYQQKAIFFLPNCDFFKPIGRTGGANTGVLSRTPVLVQ